jgi:hypothetical protein
MAKHKHSDPAADDLPGVPADAATDVAADEAADAARESAAETEGVDLPAEPDPAKPAAKPKGPPKGFETERQDQITLVLARDIALGNGQRKKGFRLGWLRTAMAVSLAEAEALIAHPHAECHCCPGQDACCLAIVTGGAVKVGEREFPVRSHVANLWLDDGVLVTEALTALKNRGACLK